MKTQLCAGRDIQQNETGEMLWRDSGGIHWRILATLRLDTDRILGRIHREGILSGILGGILCGIIGGSHWRAALVGYSAGSTGDYSGRMLGGIHWRAILGYSAGYWAGSIGALLWWDTRRDPLPSYSAGILGVQRDRRDSAASRSDGMLGGTHDPLASSGGILGGTHWRAALAG